LALWVAQSFGSGLFILAFEEAQFEQCAFLASLVSTIHRPFVLLFSSAGILLVSPAELSRFLILAVISAYELKSSLSRHFDFGGDFRVLLEIES